MLSRTLLLIFSNIGLVYACISDHDCLNYGQHYYCNLQSNQCAVHTSWFWWLSSTPVVYYGPYSANSTVYTNEYTYPHADAAASAHYANNNYQHAAAASGVHYNNQHVGGFNSFGSNFGRSGSFGGGRR